MLGHNSNIHSRKHGGKTGTTDTANGVSGGIVFSSRGLPGGDEFTEAVVGIVEMYL